MGLKNIGLVVKDIGVMLIQNIGLIVKNIGGNVNTEYWSYF